MTKDRDEARPPAGVCLANEQTILANERTLLAYLRTMMTFFIAGVTFIKFFGHPALTIVGWAFIPVSLIILGVGIVSYLVRKRAIEKAGN